MSQLYLFGRKQDYGMSWPRRIQWSPAAITSESGSSDSWNGQTVWAGAGTHDIGFEKDQRNGKVTHKIDPAVDGERDNIRQTLQASGKVKSAYYYLPPDAVQGAKNATGGGYHSDGPCSDHCAAVVCRARVLPGPARYLLDPAEP